MAKEKGRGRVALQMPPALASLLFIGLVVFIVLLVVTAVEYVVPQVMRSGAWLFLFFPIALIKMGFIAYHFMHIYHLWGKKTEVGGERRH